MAIKNQVLTREPSESGAKQPVPEANRRSGGIQEAYPFLRSLLPWGGRVAITLLAVAVLLIALKFALVAQSFLASSRSQRPPPIYLSSSPRSSESSAPVATPWPEFPHSGPRQVRTSIINGVRTLSEGWTTSADVSEVLAYYRDQMAARGWRDVTEETYSLQPESHLNLKRADAALYAENYRKIMDSTAVLTSGEWTMHIVAAPSQGRPENRVAIYAVEAASLKEFSESVEATFAPGSDQPLRALQQSGGQTYGTTISAKDESSAEAFRRELAALQAEGWHSLVLLPNQQGRPGQFAWLAKGENYMALSASPLGPDRCSITRTQVTPGTSGAGD